MARLPTWALGPRPLPTTSPSSMTPFNHMLLIVIGGALLAQILYGIYRLMMAEYGK